MSFDLWRPYPLLRRRGDNKSTLNQLYAIDNYSSNFLRKKKPQDFHQSFLGNYIWLKVQWALSTTIVKIASSFFNQVPAQSILTYFAIKKKT